MSDFTLPGLMDLSPTTFECVQPWLPLSPHSLLQNKWQGVSTIGPILINGVAPEFAAVSAVMKFSKHAEGFPVDYVCATDPDLGTGTVTMEDAAAWRFTVPEQELPLGWGLWYWWFIVEDTEGRTTPAYRGTLLIQQ